MHVVIVGNGIAGITAARFIRKLSNHEITVISKECDYFFSRTALMYMYMGHMRLKDTQPYEPSFWRKNRIDLLRAEVNQIHFADRQLTLTPINEDTEFKEAPRSLLYDKLILAVGSEPNKFGWPGQDLKRVQGLYTFQDLQNMEKSSQGLKRAVIVGGGLIGIEMAEMFHSRNIPVTFLVRESSFWNVVLPKEESEMISRHIKEHHFDLRLSTELKEILGNSDGEAIGVLTNTGEKIDCEFVGLTAGVHPNTHWLNGSGLDIQKGIVVNEYLETSIPNVYAIGDCAQLAAPPAGRRPIEAVWYVGRMMGETVAHTICGDSKQYDPGIWFNSAKFLDIEYQVYGQVSNRPPEHHQSIYWEHEDGRKSIRLVFDTNDESIVGFNVMGIRFRHEVCEKWIQNKTPIDEVVGQLKLANFDPEFYDQYEEEFVNKYNSVRNRSVRTQKKSILNQALTFLKAQ